MENQNQIAVQDGTHTAVYNPQTVTERIMSGASGNFLTTIQNDSPQAAARIFNAINDNDGNIRDMLNQPLVVTDLMAFPVSIVDQDGEVIDGIRVVLITKDGKSYGSVAQGVFSALQNIIAIVGMGPWPNGITLVPVEKTTRRGFRTMTFRMEA